MFFDVQTAKRMIAEVDRARENYQHRYYPEVKSVYDGKDIMIDSSRFGVDQTADILCNLVLKQYNQ